MSSHLTSYDLSQITVLVCDDNGYMRRMIRNTMESFGVRRVVEAHDGAEGFAELVTWNPDIVITDWSMGDASGLDFVRLIRQSEKSPNPYVPVIMLTGFTELERVEQARDAGITSYLAKPMSVTSLYKRLCSVVEDHRNFVRLDSFMGPDRRNRAADVAEAAERRAAI